MTLLTELGGFIREVARIPVDAYIDIESKVSSKGLVFTIWSATVCYMMVNNIPISEGFGSLYQLVAAAYFGVGALVAAKKGLSK